MLKRTGHPVKMDFDQTQHFMNVVVESNLRRIEEFDAASFVKLVNAAIERTEDSFAGRREEGAVLDLARSEEIRELMAHWLDNCRIVEVDCRIVDRPKR